MRSILRELYNGSIIPWERKVAPSKALLETVRKIEDGEQYFAQKMPPDDCQRLQALSKLYAELSSIEEENIFSYGFALGLLLTLDVMKEAETIDLF